MILVLKKKLEARIDSKSILLEVTSSVSYPVDVLQIIPERQTFVTPSDCETARKAIFGYF